MARSVNALDLLRRDHEKVQKLFDRFEKTRKEDKQRELYEEIVNALCTHTRIEKLVFYPALREVTAREDLFQEATIERETVSNLLDQLEHEQDDTGRFQAMVKVLGEYVAHHVKEEEDIFLEMEDSDADLKALGKAQEACCKGEGDHSHQEKVDERFLREHGEDLSRGTQRAKWIHATGDEPDHDVQTLATRSAEVIRAWAEARGEQPVSREAWLDTFEERELVFLYRETMKAGNQSNFSRLDSPEREDG